MSDKIIYSHRYKKTTRKKADLKKKQKARFLDEKKENEAKLLKEKHKLKENKENITTAKEKVNTLLNLNRVEKDDKDSEDDEESFDEKVKKEKSRKNKKNKKSKKVKKIKKDIYIPKSFKVFGAILAIFVISFLSKVIIEMDKSSIIKVFSSKDENGDLVNNYDLKVGVYSLDTTDFLTSQNIILKELEKLSSARLIKINSDYTVEYLGARTIEKVSNSEYNVLLNSKYDISISDVENSIKSIKNAGESNVYYKYLSKVSSIEKISDTQFKIILEEDNPYFLYALDFPITSADAKTDFKLEGASEGSITILKNNLDTSINSITLSNYSDTDKMVQDFRDDKIDVFFASSNNAMQLIGKHEYSVKKYRNGETIFILGNKNSKLYSKKEIRQGILYSLNREEIVKDANSNYGEIIDLPFIYSSIKYKYDVYEAQNVLVTNSWVKGDDGIFYKEENGEVLRAELTLLVNSEDEDKKQIAESIVTMCKNSGISITANYMSQDEIKESILNNEYDIVLADVVIGDYPDVTYLRDYLEINDSITTALSEVENSSVEALPASISNLENVLSDEVACIGIMARNINVVYQKYITGFDNVSYFKVFNNIENIGKVNDKIGGD